MEYIYEHYFTIGFTLAFLLIVYFLIKNDADTVLFVAISSPFWGIVLPTLILTFVYVYYKNILSKKRALLFKLNSFIVSLIAIVIMGCSNDGIEKPDTDYTIRVLDSCEYIVFDEGLAQSRIYAMSHKGNCKFCKARLNKK